jgi:hypothetical protein
MTNESRNVRGGNLLTAAATLAAGLVVGSVVLVVGAGWVADRAMTRFESAVHDHSAAVTSAGTDIGTAAQRGFDTLSTHVDQHTGAVDRAGQRIAQPVIKITTPIEVQQPLRIEGPREDGALPVNARIAK